jgi:hypothetical protein
MRRVERSPLGQAFLTLVMAVLVGALLVWNLPPGPAKEALLPAAGRVVQAAGLEQDWGLFAPEPRGSTVGVFATITHADGRTERWDPPDRGLILAPYRTYRWQKYVERLRDDRYERMWEPTARWIGREAGPDVTRVVLTRTFRGAVTPGDPGPRPATEHFSFYTLELR